MTSRDKRESSRIRGERCVVGNVETPPNKRIVTQKPQLCSFVAGVPADPPPPIQLGFDLGSVLRLFDRIFRPAVSRWLIRLPTRISALMGDGACDRSLSRFAGEGAGTAGRGVLVVGCLDRNLLRHVSPYPAHGRHLLGLFVSRRGPNCRQPELGEDMVLPIPHSRSSAANPSARLAAKGRDSTPDRSEDGSLLERGGEEEALMRQVEEKPRGSAAR